MAREQDEVSEKQWEVYLFVVRFLERHGYQPSIREIADALGVDKRAVQDRIRRLVRKGLVERGNRDRAIRLKHVRFEPKFDAPAVEREYQAGGGIPRRRLRASNPAEVDAGRTVEAVDAEYLPRVLALVHAGASHEDILALNATYQAARRAAASPHQGTSE